MQNQGEPQPANEYYFFDLNHLIIFLRLDVYKLKTRYLAQKPLKVLR
jgi:hypothetical protein